MATAAYGTFLNEKVEQQLARRRLRRKQKAKLNTENWMSRVDDNALVSALSIPGTHDSCAFTSIWPFVSTQTLDITQQLTAGIRYFDFRCGLKSNTVQMVHGRAMLGLVFEDVLDAMYTWLDAHPSEGLVVQIKQDRAEEDSDILFSAAIFQVLDKHPQYWRTIPTTPILQELRGKIQLFRRFRGPAYRGISVARWQDNPTTPFTIHTFAGVQVTIQDHYTTSEPMPLSDFIARKGGDVSDLLKKAIANKDLSHWYINFASAFQINWIHTATPKEVALGGWHNFNWVTGINPMLCQYLKEHALKRHTQRYGIIAMDFPVTSDAADLIKGIIEANYAEKKKTSFWRHGITFVAMFLILLYLGGVILLYVHGPMAKSRCLPFLQPCTLSDKS